MSCLVSSILFNMNHCHVLSGSCPYVTSAVPEMNPWAQLALKWTERGQRKFTGGGEGPGSEQNQMWVSTFGVHWFGHRGPRGPGRCGLLATWAAHERLGSGLDAGSSTAHSHPRGQPWFSSGGGYPGEGSPVATSRLCQEEPENWIFIWNLPIFRSS